MSVGKKLLASLAANEDGFARYIKMDLRPELFLADEQGWFELFDEHLSNYGVFPSQETIEETLGETLPETPEPPEFYQEHVERRHLHQTMKTLILEGQSLLTDKRAADCYDMLAQGVMDMMLSKNRRQIVDAAKEGGAIVEKDYKQKMLLGDEYGIGTGWPYLDNMIGGLLPGDFLTVSGRPGMGKTYMMMSIAEYIWRVQKKVPLVVSMEMKPLPLVQRLAAMHTHVSITQLKLAALTTKGYQKLMAGMSNMSTQARPFWMVDGALASTVRDVALYARQLKPDVVLVDGAYLLQHPDKRVAMWERIKGTAEGLKRVISDGMGIPVVASYQLNREAVKKSKNEGKLGLDNLGGGDAIGQISSVVLAMLEMEAVETLKHRTVSVLKGRGGEMGDFKINWLFNDQGPNGYMNFRQVAEQAVEDLEYV